MFKKRTLALIFCIAFLGANAKAATILVTTFLGTNEVPPNASTGTGLGTFILNDAHTQLEVIISFSGLVATDVAAHIHCCGPIGVNDPVVLPFTGGAGFPTGVTSGTFDHVFTLATDLSGITPTVFVTGLLSGQAYANIHSTQFPGGEIRGQIEPLPEPAAVGMIALGLVGMAIIRRRKISARI